LGDGYPHACVQHGDTAGLMQNIMNMRPKHRVETRTIPAEIMAKFSQGALLSKLIATIEDNSNRKGA
jgi:hypothetical protein